MHLFFKNPVNWLSLLLVVTAVSCNNDKRTELFELNYHVDFDIPPGLNTFDTHFFVISPFDSQYDENLAAAGLTADDVISIEAKDAFLSSTFGDINLKFIERISIYIFDPFNP